MKRELILHVGTTKTGSTSIQYALASMRDTLAEHGVCYPKSPGEVAHHLLPAAFVGDESLHQFRAAGWNGLAPRNRLDLFRREFAEEMQALPAHLTRCVLSSELISTRLPEEAQLRALAAFLEPFFSRIAVILYIRRQDQHVASDYNQLLRNGHLEEPRLFRDDGKPDPRVRALDYASMLHRFSSVFGRDAMVARVFSREDLHGGDVIDDFLAVTDIPIIVPEQSRDRQRNVGMSIEGQMLMLRAMRLKSKDGQQTYDKSWRRLSETVTKVSPGRGWRPTRDEARAFMRHFEVSNEAVRRAYFPDRQTLFSERYDDLPENSEMPTSEAILDTAIQILLAEMNERVRREVSHRLTQYRLNKRLGDSDAMHAALSRVIELAPEEVGPRLRMAELLLERGKPALAREHAEAALRLNPELKLAADIRNQAAARLAPGGAAPVGPRSEKRRALDRRGASSRESGLDRIE